MTWNHRVIRRILPTGEEYYAIHEVFYNPDGTIWGATMEGVDVSGYSIEDLQETIELMKKALRHPVINYEDIPPDDMSDEDYLDLLDDEN